MSKISRRGLFGLGAGAAAVPFIKPETPVETGPSVTVFHSTGTWTKPHSERIEIVVVGAGGGFGGSSQSRESYSVVVGKGGVSSKS